MVNFEKLFRNKSILITGGTGFLGRALIREILKYHPQSIRLFSRDEVKHHRVNLEFGFDFPHGKLRHFIGDVRDYERLKKAMRGCDIVIHAAALKRIDMIEYNVEESIKTNILGSLNVVKAALDNRVEKVVFISTDKACSPVNTYGACKFVSERVFIESNFSKGKSKTSLICVRYGNVINSTGSVIPFFVEKIKKGEEVPITDERMTRFLITEKQAVKLIFNALFYGQGGEVFVPRIPAFKITDLADYLAQRLGKECKKKFVGIRPGEKLHELMINELESPRTLELEDFFIIQSQIKCYQPDKRVKYPKSAKRVNLEDFNSINSLLQGEECGEYLARIINI